MGNWLDSSQASAYAGTDSKGRPHISARTLRKLCRDRKIYFGKNGREYKFRPEHIDAYFMANGFDGSRT